MGTRTQICGREKTFCASRLTPEGTVENHILVFVPQARSGCGAGSVSDVLAC